MFRGYLSADDFRNITEIFERSHFFLQGKTVFDPIFCILVELINTFDKKTPLNNILFPF